MSKKAGECPPNERGHHLTSEPGHGYSSHFLHTTLVPNTIPGYLRSRGCCKGRPAESAAEHQKGHSLGTHRPLTQQGGPWPCGRSPDKGLPIQRGTDSSSTHHEHARLLPIHEALGNGVWSQDLISEEGKRSLVILPIASIPRAWNIGKRLRSFLQCNRHRILYTNSPKERRHRQIPPHSFLRLNDTRKV